MLYNSLLILRVKLVQVYFEDKKDKSSFLYKIFSVDSVKVQNYKHFIVYFRVQLVSQRSCFIPTIYTWLNIYWHICYVVWYIVLCGSTLHWLCEESEEHYMTIVFRTIANYPFAVFVKPFRCDQISVWTVWPRKQK